MRRLFAAAALGLAPGSALAHHAMDGAMPEMLLHGLLSGAAHPIIGFDHLAFVVAAGVLAAMAGRLWTAPLGLIAGALGGAALHLGALDVAGSEILVALSVAIAGLAVLFGARAGGGLLVAGFALAGSFHGYAYAETVIGAERGVIAAYLASFSLTQWAVAVLAGLAARVLIGQPAWARTRAILGAALTLIGAAFVIQAV